MFTALHNGVALCTAMMIEIPRSEVIHKLAKVLSLGPNSLCANLGSDHHLGLLLLHWIAKTIGCVKGLIVANRNGYVLQKEIY